MLVLAGWVVEKQANRLWDPESPPCTSAAEPSQTACKGYLRYKTRQMPRCGSGGDENGVGPRHSSGGGPACRRSTEGRCLGARKTR
jgi:hypothetical protein